MSWFRQDEKQRSTSVASRTVEEAFVSGESEVQVVKGQRVYVVSFRGTAGCPSLGPDSSSGLDH